MSKSPLKSRSENPNAPKIPYPLYIGEKENFAGFLLNAVFYGFVIILFSRCMGALLNPTDHGRGSTKWVLVAHTVAMFAFATIATAINLYLQSISYVDNREFPGIAGVLPPGALTYQQFIYREAISVVPNTMFLLNTWLADGLLLYRCWVIYAMKYWVIAFPCLMYLASLAMGITLIYYQTLPEAVTDLQTSNVKFGTPYFTICLSLNVILTLMIVGRLLLHSRNVRNATGAPATTSGLYTAIVTMLVESCALYAVNFILFIGPWGADNNIANFFFPILTETQVIAPLLITLRVANRSALTSESIVSGNIGSIRFGGHGKSTGGSETLSDWNPTNTVDAHEETSGEHGIRVEDTIDEVPS